MATIKQLRAMSLEEIRGLADYELEDALILLGLDSFDYETRTQVYDVIYYTAQEQNVPLWKVEPEAEADFEPEWLLEHPEAEAEGEEEDRGFLDRLKSAFYVLRTLRQRVKLDTPWPDYIDGFVQSVLPAGPIRNVGVWYTTHFTFGETLLALMILALIKVFLGDEDIELPENLDEILADEEEPEEAEPEEAPKPKVTAKKPAPKATKPASKPTPKKTGRKALDNR